MTDNDRISADDDPRRDIDQVAEAADADVAGLTDDALDPSDPEPSGSPDPTPFAPEPTGPEPLTPVAAATVPLVAESPDPLAPEPSTPEPLMPVTTEQEAFAPEPPVVPIHEGSDPTVDEAMGGAHSADEPAIVASAAAAASRPGTRGMGHVAEHEAADTRDWWKVWLLRTGVALLATLILTTGLAWAWIGGMTNPHARSIPVGIIVGDTAAATVLAADQQRSEIQIVRYANARDASSALAKRNVDAILASDQTGNGTGLNLIIASAAGPGVANAVLDSVNSVTNTLNVPLAVADAYPTSEKDVDGRTPFYLMLIWVLGGVISAILLGVTLGTVPRDLDRLGMRLLALLGFALALGLTASLFAVPFLGIWHHHLFGLWMSGTLIVFTAALITSALQSWIGMWGIGVAVLLMIVLGVPGAGGQWAPALLPGFFRSMHTWIPNGLGTDLIRGVEYFGRNANTWPITGLALWSLASILALVGSTIVLGRHARPTFFDTPDAVDATGPAETP
jgi:hypothetical protein